MNELLAHGEQIPVKYSIKIDPISDMIGYNVEIKDKYNLNNYTLSGIFLELSVALKEADTFVNDLYEKELTMYIN